MNVLNRFAATVADHETTNPRPLDTSAPSDREWREWRDGQTLSAEEWRRWARN